LRDLLVSKPPRKYYISLENLPWSNTPLTFRKWCLYYKCVIAIARVVNYVPESSLTLLEWPYILWRHFNNQDDHGFIVLATAYLTPPSMTKRQRKFYNFETRLSPAWRPEPKTTTRIWTTTTRYRLVWTKLKTPDAPFLIRQSSKSSGKVSEWPPSAGTTDWSTQHKFFIA